LSGGGRSDRPAPLGAVLAITFLGSVSGGAFWSGLFFVTAQHYRFSPERNLTLAMIMGAVYALAARGAGALSEAGRRRGPAPRTVLLGALAAWTAAALGPPLFPRAEAVLWASALLGAAASASVWPVVESYLAAGRHGARMRAALGWFNVTWTPATAVNLLIMPLVASHAGVTWTIGLSALFNTGAMLLLPTLARQPGAHAPEAAQAAVGAEYPWLVRSASWLLPLSYVMSSTLAPVLPSRVAAVGAVAAPPSVVAALWMLSRFGTLLLMWRTGFWHGRWGTLAAGGAALASGLALVLLATTPAALIAGLLIFGAGMGLTYYAALYYSMAVGHAAVEAGGNFEALIGLGYFLGPLLGLIGHAAARPAHAGSATVALTWLVAGLAAAGALRPYRAARRQRRAGANP
jgi:hypothetical protein